ncbi:MAG: rod shape-determining protein MreC [Deltaproteobacteria bacterium]|nr:rod shape-determining protein MreC [Deltaproteobacteria bacterium]
MNVGRRYWNALLSVLLLGVSFYFLRASLRDPGTQTEIDRQVLRSTAWVQWLGDQVARGLATVWDEYIYLVHVRRENERLRAEVARLRQDAQRYRASYEENRRLRRMLQLRVDTPVESLAAEVVARDPSPFFRVMRLAITTQDVPRLRVGMPVVTFDGVVGQINSVVDRYANVTLVADSRSAIDSMIERTGARGIVHGSGERHRYRAQVEYLQRTDDVRVGDAVVTSGLGCRFPPGLLLGRVSSVTRRDFGLYQEVEITPAVDFSRLQEVLVLATPQQECRPGLQQNQRRPARAGSTGGGTS